MNSGKIRNDPEYRRVSEDESKITWKKTRWEEFCKGSKKYRGVKSAETKKSGPGMQSEPGPDWNRNGMEIPGRGRKVPEEWRECRRGRSRIFGGTGKTWTGFRNRVESVQSEAQPKTATRFRRHPESNLKVPGSFRSDHREATGGGNRNTGGATGTGDEQDGPEWLTEFRRWPKKISIEGSESGEDVARLAKTFRSSGRPDKTGVSFRNRKGQTGSDIVSEVEMEFNEGWTTPDVKGPVKKRPERGGGRAGDGDKVREFRKVLVDNSRVMKGVMVMRNGDPKRSGKDTRRKPESWKQPQY
ncbi:hypothetical protein DFH09DRAFT_1103345 [Mycena vulgaris]|nr:hypothetical protein DFH09DRAFT_1103345 [Mycena vulgaris]